MSKVTNAVRAYKKCRICGYQTNDESKKSCNLCGGYLYTYSSVFIPKIRAKK